MHAPVRSVPSRPSHQNTKTPLRRFAKHPIPFSLILEGSLTHQDLPGVWQIAATSKSGTVLCWPHSGMVEDGGWMIVGEMMEGRSYDTKRGILMRNCWTASVINVFVRRKSGFSGDNPNKRILHCCFNDFLRKPGIIVWTFSIRVWRSEQYSGQDRRTCWLDSCEAPQSQAGDSDRPRLYEWPFR